MLTNAFKEAVAEKNIRKIRIMLKDSLLVDPSFESFTEMEKFASLVEGLYDEHDGREMIDDPGLWDDDYMDKMMVKVVGNFSHERVEHLKKVVRYLRPVSEKKTGESQRAGSTSRKSNTTSVNRNRRSEYQDQKRRDQLSGDYRGSKIAGGVVVGGIVGAGIGAVFSMSGTAMAGAVAIGALGGGVAVAAFTEKE